MPISEITFKDPEYPRLLSNRLQIEAPPFISYLGNINLLNYSNAWAIIGSIDYPEEYKTIYLEFIEFLASNQIVVISGFHSPIEKIGLTVLSEKGGLVIHVLARSLYKYRIPKISRKLNQENKYLWLSTTMPSVHRTSIKLTNRRNVIACSLSENVLVLSQNPKSKTMNLAKQMKELGCNVFQLSQNKCHLFEDVLF